MDAPRPSAIQRIRSSIWEHTSTRRRVAARLGVFVACIGLASSAGVWADTSVGSSGDSVLAAAPAPSATPALDFTARDAASFGAVARFVDAASGPTSTPEQTPSPEPTLVPPPSPTGRPVPVQQTVTELVQRQEPVPPPPAPTAPPPLPTAAAPSPAPPAPPPAPIAPPPANVPWGLNTAPMDAYAQQLFDDTNARRAGTGLPALRANGYLIGIARIRSQDMADHNYFAHTSPITGDTAFTLMDAHGVPYGWAGENLAKNNYPDAQAVAVADEALWNSPHHRENILNPNYTDMGIALVIDAAGMKYFTIIFTGPA
ncbi:MAG: CAP domain-containing protein [Chloroflexota bacterium]|nr:CAP domain-containing protein [Chloroflexota bacterium]